MTSPIYFDMFELAHHLRFVDHATGAADQPRAVRWLHRMEKKGLVTPKKRGRAVLVRRDEVERALEPDSYGVGA